MTWRRALKVKKAFFMPALLLIVIRSFIIPNIHYNFPLRFNYIIFLLKACD